MTKTNTSQKTIDWALVIIVNFMWATQVPVIRLIGDSMGAVTVAFVPMILSSLIFLPILAFENKKRGVGFRYRFRDFKVFLLPAIIGVFVMQYAYTVGSRYTLAANAGIITLTIPVLVAVFAAFLLKEKLNAIRIISFLIAIIGVLITSVSDLRAADFGKGQFLAGNLIFLFASACCAFYNTYCKLLVDKGYTELEIMVYSSLIGSILSIPLLDLDGTIQPDTIPELRLSPTIWHPRTQRDRLRPLDDPLLLGAEKNGRHAGHAGQLSSALLHRILGVWLLNEKITLTMLIGGGLILASTLMVTIYEERLLNYFRSRRKINPKPTTLHSIKN